MSLVRRIARPLLAASFVQSGLDAVLHPVPHAEAAKDVVRTVTAPLGVTDDPELFVRVNGAAMAGAGALLSLGRLPRLAATVLAATMIPTTYAEHAFWTEKDPEQRRSHRKQFLLNLGLIAGALLAAVDTEGKPGLVWRGRHAARHAEKAARHAEHTARRATKDAKKVGRRARRAAKLEARNAVQTVHDRLPG
jgi:putative oxidoreductase